ncbi:35531_t:CDS:1, partial [Gigaspora margarita]
QKSQIQKKAKNYFIENNKIYQRNKEKLQKVIKNDQKHLILYMLYDEQG